MERLDGSLFGPGQPCFGCAPDHPFGFRLVLDRIDGGVETRFLPTDRHQGPPGLMHGGLAMALADEIGAWAVIAATGKFGFTASIEGKLLRPIRIGEEVMGVGRVTKGGTRVVTTAVTITQRGEDAFAASLRFMLVDEAGAEKLLGRPIPDAWRRFSR